ncbi:MAG: DUF4395 family protein [Actinomycetota bacterium]
MLPDPEAVDDREVRVVQGALAVGLLAAFVFGQPALVPAAAVVTGLGAALGPHANPLHAGFRALLGRREIKARLPPVPVASVRALDVCATVVLVLATLSLAVGVSPIGWLLALIAAGIAAVAAFTRYNVATALRERLRRDRN